MAADAVDALLAGSGFAGFVTDGVFGVPVLALGDADGHVGVRGFIPLELEHFVALLFGRACGLLVEVVDARGGDVLRALGDRDTLVAEENEGHALDAMPACDAGRQQCSETYRDGS